MHGSMRELMRLKLRAKIYSTFIGLGIIFVALGILLEKVDSLDLHESSAFVLVTIMLYQVFVRTLTSLQPLTHCQL